MKNEDSKIINFYTKYRDKEEVRSTGKPPSRTDSFHEEDDFINTIFSFSFNKKISNRIGRKQTNDFFKSILETAHHANLMMAEKREKEHKRKNVSILKFIKEFIFSVSFSETILLRTFLLIKFSLSHALNSFMFLSTSGSAILKKITPKIVTWVFSR